MTIGIKQGGIDCDISDILIRGNRFKNSAIMIVLPEPVGAFKTQTGLSDRANSFRAVMINLSTTVCWNCFNCMFFLICQQIAQIVQIIFITLQSVKSV
jgi:hypothetical protein